MNESKGSNTVDTAYKTLLVVRHAKSSWDVATINDFERPLNERGKKDAPEMAKRLKDKKIHIDAFVASPARRAKKTAELFCEIYGAKASTIEYVSKLYHADPDAFEAVVTDLNNTAGTVAIFSHNPGITQFVNMLTDVRIDNMPTCSIFAVRAHTSKWTDFMKSDKEFLFFDYPKLVAP